MGRMDSGTVSPSDSMRCYRHPDRSTSLRCSRCDRPICPFCSHDSPVGQRCPDCSRGSRATRVVNARRLATGITPAVLVIMVVSVVAYLVQRQNVQFTIDYAHITEAIRYGEWWRAVTAAFLHSRGSVLHIVFNMYALYLFGPRLERQVGTVSFVGLYLASAVSGAVAFQYLSDGGAVGASGAIFGLFGAVLIGTYPASPCGSAPGWVNGSPHAVMAPSTVGTFLRSFTWGHVRPGEGVDLGAGPCVAVWVRPGKGPVTLDVDSTICAVSGKTKQGAAVTPKSWVITRCWRSVPVCGKGLLLAINLALPLLVPGIAWEAHVGGLVAGMIIVSIWQRIPYGPRAPVLRALAVYGLGVVALLAIVVA